MLESHMTTTDPFVLALQRLSKAVGGHDNLAQMIGANGQSIYQIVSERKLPSGNAKSVGPALRAKISEQFPDWLKDSPAGEDGGRPPEIASALEALAAALVAADDLTVDQARPLLARLVDEPGRSAEIIPRLAAVLSSQQRADVARALAKNKNAPESPRLGGPTFAGGGDEPTFAKKQ